MTRSAAVSALGSEFNDFLFAPIGEDRNDMPLSVLSALARLGLDPWQEAAELARLPPETATQRLVASIAALSDGLTVHLDIRTIAARLIALLPHPARPTVLPGAAIPDADEITKFRAGIRMFAVLIAIMLAAQWIVASREPQTQVDGKEAPLSNTVVPNPPPNSGQ
ncbi:MAG: hypothetical protein WAL80_22060 [Xanthobacteraceae bacterium]|jgi:hypothetical protein